MLLSTREKEMIALLIKYHSQYITIHDIAQQLAVSSRTIHRELKGVEAYLTSFSLTLERANKKGLRIAGADSDLNDLKQSIAQHQTIDLSVEEQKVIIIYALIQAKEPVKQYSLAQEIGVSVQTLAKMLDDLELDLNKYQLSLSRKRGEGIYLVGTESKKREFLSQLMVNNLNSTSVYSVIENHFVFHSLNQIHKDFVDLERIFNVERLLMDYLSALPYQLTESSYLTLTVHIVLSISRIKNGEYVALNDDIYDSVQNTFEHKVANELADKLGQIYDVTFNQAEIAFITIHLRGAKRKNLNDTSLNNRCEENKIKAFVNKVEMISGMTFADLDTLVDGLTLHLNPAINRLQANIETYNPLTDMIKFKYPRLFENVRLALNDCWPDLIFPESEIAFIVLHFGGSIKNQGNRFLNILVVCSSGMGTSRLLSTRLEQVFSEIERITQASVSDLKSLDLSQYDGIISTVNLDIDSPYLTVNPLLPDSDISYVAQFLNTKSTFQETHDKSSNMIDKDDVHVETKDVDGNTSFENEQTSYLTSVFEKHLSDEKSEQLLHHMRSGLTLLDSVKIVSTEVKQWQTYIADYLYQCDVINDPTSFAELLEQRLIDNPGWILSPYPVAIPHLRDNMIKHPMILITVLEEPLTLPSIQNDNQTIKYMISMFIPDNDFMASLVSDLSEFLSLKLESIDTFMENPQELETLLRNKFLERIKKQFI
ncbi:TPA: BglG family transcription antiterminator [Staphylococcus aureus]|uniref:BglG family transcription antiterminator n=1 Tax=Staphylococcus aureus TaxID=1280 RepID=UPI0012A9D724|nr:BglG family transcription antiterminator [Staphylococcus aureus]EGQ0496399.1 BglG family transcription antiterminator [Staphylococcus aureus]EJX2372228.1 BglG family transcription antiterminator [Staphylococcus aureus]EJX3528461.1 BglG family transcription antiterminator [Staphylococcus aureus]EKF1538879.1 BglG family transcription antiterminator [Staphylococcus aureus]ELG9955269.1 BglG family transcription antiterminator [Staphylococcus aureus]